MKPRARFGRIRTDCWSAIRILIFLLALGQSGVFAALPNLPEYREKPGEGKELVQELLSRVPRENREFSGTFQIFPPGGGPRRNVPFKMTLDAGERSWKDTYTSEGVAGDLPERLVIEHRENAPNRYFLSKGQGAEAPGKPLSPKEIFQPFANSDFWICDLGLEFLHWPKQRIVKKEMRKSRSCRVLESMNPDTGSGYLRVLSWIDFETGDLVRAEGYDLQNKLLKEFSIRSLKKVDGRWQLKKMEITNEQTDSRTVIEYDLDLDK
jgi:hypothetical protein